VKKMNFGVLKKSHETMDFQLGAETFDMFRAEGRTERGAISGGSSWGLADLMKHNKSFVSVKGTS
jgi:hypothetical protein